MSDHFLILTRREGTGGVQHHSAWAEHISSFQDQVFLYIGKFSRFLRSPVTGKGFFFSEHAFTGAWGVQKNFIEEGWKTLCKPGRFFISNKHVFDAKELQISKKGSCSGSADIIGKQKARII